MSEEVPEIEKTRCGYVTLIGAPNAGKSTLLNQLVGAKIAIVSPKVQTTRARVTAIAVEGQSQIIFVDTPGIFAPSRRLEKAMVNAAWDGVQDADVLALIIDANRGISKDVERIIDGLKKAEAKAHLILNKIDMIKREKLLGLVQELTDRGIFEDVFMISALNGDGVDHLRQTLAGQVPEGPWLFPEDQLATAPMRNLAAEVTREKLFLRLNQELPYSLTVETEKWEERKDGSVKIDQVVYVSRANHKPIVLGKGGATIKQIGAMAREELEEMMGCRVHLFLFVKVREKWLDDPERYQEMGLEFPKN
ncbi:GTPase Era [Sneathiella sp. P13V-1]|uniref:GTPase Era n=1 Tax=Sneathiella sp. P13V-1 TaxID=2697366 RepID=UPI00187B534B|nr:GTPase Era [Sneathiella sp. P13V-1]MBE7638336.1 GTPase Era [Sneathiella sp. P13V-1]